MALVVIIMQDVAGGDVTIQARFEPNLLRGRKMTPAQQRAVKALEDAAATDAKPETPDNGRN